MATGKFRIKTANDWNTIFYRFKHSNQFDIECSTGIQIPNKRWSESKQEVLKTDDVDYIEMNHRIKGLDTFIRKEYERSKLSAETVNTNWLKEKINLNFNRETNNVEIDKGVFLSNYISAFIEEAKTRKTKNNTVIKHRTIQHYTTALNKVLAFEIYTRSKIKLLEIDVSFHTRFIDYLETQEKLNPNTIGGYVDVIKLICGNADKKGIAVSKEFRLTEFYTPSNKTKDVYLNNDEINLIFNTTFDQDYLDNARDWFIIGLRTGLRISDFLKLSKEYLVDGFIHKQTLKTDFPVIIPIHDQVKAILEKRNGEFPRQISDQKFNDYIKIICEKIGLNEMVDGAKITEMKIKENSKTIKIHRKNFGKFPKHELVSSHICRRSFATNLYGKIDTLTIMKITGHKTESQFLAYIKITPREYAERLKDYWKKIQQS